jgi:hypothetical protein
LKGYHDVTKSLLEAVGVFARLREDGRHLTNLERLVVIALLDISLQWYVQQTKQLAEILHGK